MRSTFLIAVSLIACVALATVQAGAVTLADLASHARALAARADSAEQAGVDLPPGLFPAISAALSANDNFTNAELGNLDKSLSDFADVLSMLASNPAPVGSTTFDVRDADSLVAGATVSLTQRVHLSASLGAGAAIMVAKHWMGPWPLQDNSPQDDDFVSVANPGGVSLKPATVERSGIYGGRYSEEPVPVFEVASGKIPAGTTIDVKYSNLTLPIEATDNFPLPVYVRLTANGPFVPVPGPGPSVRPGKLARLSLYAPVVVKTGEQFQVNVAMTDAFGNPVPAGIPPVDVLVDGAVARSLPAGTNASLSVTLSLPLAGDHHIEVRSAGGGLISSAHIDAQDTPAYRVQWVELHAHTRRSDGLQTGDAVMQRMLGAVDSVYLIEHDDELSDGAWQARPMQALDGFEWSGGIRSGGHQVALSSSRFTFPTSPRLAFPSERALVRDVHGPGTLMIALPEVPADIRFIDPQVTRLVEIKAGTSTFEWYGNRLASRGYRVGFTGSATAHNRQAGAPSSTGHTAVIVRRPGETLFDALMARRTWVTSGPRIFLETTVNGGSPGERVPASVERRITGRVTGTAGIASIDLIRNGEVIATRDLSADTTSQTVKVTFRSSSAPLGAAQDLPRNGREWIGFVRAKDARVAAVDTTTFRNPARQAAVINPGDASRVDFITWTRGAPSSFTFDLGAISDDLTLEMSLRSGFEDNDEVPLYRPPGSIPAARMIVTAQELLAGRVTRRYDVDGYQDVVTFELVNKAPADMATFDFADTRPHGNGDYYYVRVTQVDDEMAWSSPVWVGGFDLR